jgi:hypothetical protein
MENADNPFQLVGYGGFTSARWRSRRRGREDDAFHIGGTVYRRCAKVEVLVESVRSRNITAAGSVGCEGIDLGRFPECRG